jgi:hypothetical protein
MLRSPTKIAALAIKTLIPKYLNTDSDSGALTVKLKVADPYPVDTIPVPYSFYRIRIQPV